MTISYKIDLDRENDSGIYYVHWRTTVKGKVRNVRSSLKTRDFAETDEALKRFLIKKGEKVDTAAKSGVVYTIADLWAFYMEKLAKGRSGAKFQRVWDHVMSKHFGHLTVPEVTDFVVQDYVGKRLSGKLSCPGQGGLRAGKPVSEPTVRNELVKLLACMNYCSQRHHCKILFDPTLIAPFVMPDAGKARDRHLEAEEINALLSAAKERSRKEGKLSRIEAFVYLALGTAGRESAIRTLTFDPKRVNFKQGWVNLDDGQRLKGDKKRAIVPMGKTLRAVLERLLAESDTSVPLAKRYVLGHPGQVWPTLQRVVYEAGLAPDDYKLPNRYQQPFATGISPHILRHTAATHMAAAGVPLAKIAKYLGNSIVMVEKTYSHLQPGHLTDASDVTDVLLAPRPPVLTLVHKGAA